MIVLVPDDDIVSCLSEFLTPVDLIGDRVGKRHAAAHVLDEIVLFKMGSGKSMYLSVEKRRPGQMQQRPKEAVGKATVIAMHMSGVEIDEPQVEIIFPEMETHPSVGLDHDPWEMVRRVPALGHSSE
jgi:hypothetical protein